jgi:phage terminase small subunit
LINAAEVTAAIHHALLQRRNHMEMLPKYLLQHLLEALRRDMRYQEDEAIRTIGDMEANFYHRFNRGLAGRFFNI